MNIRIKRLNANAVVPQYARPGDSGFDLVAIEDVIIEPGETIKVRTGIAFEIPDGYELQIRPRSGISYRTPLRIPNSPATIDAGFRGEVEVLIENTNPPVKWCCNVASDINDEDYRIDGGEQVDAGTYFIRKGEKFAQGVIAPVIRATLEVADELSDTERSTNGFGSTGI